MGGNRKSYRRVVGMRARMSRDFSHTLSFIRLGHPAFHLAVSRCANSSWNMITAHRNMGLCASSLNSNGEEICTPRQYRRTSGVIKKSSWRNEGFVFRPTLHRSPSGLIGVSQSQEGYEKKGITVCGESKGLPPDAFKRHNGTGQKRWLVARLCVFLTRS